MGDERSSISNYIRKEIEHMSLDNDAREFGQYIKQGSWGLGLLVARNCEPGKPGRPAAADAENQTHELVSGPDELSPDSDTPSKVSQTAFAGKAGVSQSYVSTYYRAWQLAADDGYCQRAEDLSPGEEDLEDFEEEDVEHTRELWSKYLEKARKPKKSRTTGNAQGFCSRRQRTGSQTQRTGRQSTSSRAGP